MTLRGSMKTLTSGLACVDEFRLRVESARYPGGKVEDSG